MVNKPLDMRYIYKRERYLEKRRSINEGYSSRIEKPKYNDNDFQYKLSVDKYLQECYNYNDALSLLEDIYSNNKFNLLEAAVQKVINEIIPTVEAKEIGNLIESISFANIGDINKDRLLEEAKVCKSIDRIRKNHNKLTKRFNINSNYSRTPDEKKRCMNVCEMVDTYGLSSFIKFNIALEELCLLELYSGSKIPQESVVEYVTEYFLLRNTNTEDDIESYKRAINESKVLREGTDSRVKYLFKSNTDSKYWLDKLNEWKVSTKKDINTLIELAQCNCGNMEILQTIIDTITEFSEINNLDFDLKSMIENMNIGLDENQANNILSIIKEYNISSSNEFRDSLNCILEAELNDSVYDDGTTEPQTFTSDEIDKFKLHNLIVDSQSVGEFLDQLEKSSMKENRGLNLNRISVNPDNVTLNESNIPTYVDANGYISMKLRSYSFNENALSEIHKFLESSTSCMNNMLYNRDSKVYYTLNENIFDFSIRSKYKVELSAYQEDMREFTMADKKLLCDIERNTQVLESVFCNPLFESIIDKLNTDKSYAAEIVPQEAALVYDILSPYIDRDNNFMESFIQSCREEANPKFDKIKSTCSCIPIEEFDFNEDHQIRLEFCAEVMGIPINEGKVMKKMDNTAGNIQGKFKNMAGIPSNKNNMTTQPSIENNTQNMQQNNQLHKMDNENSNPPQKYKDQGNDEKEPLSINDMKLAWQGVKSKLKRASAKEQEMSRDLDLEFNHVIKTLQMAGPDHREEIITGEVNRSLSKVIKMAIGFAALGATGGAIAAPVGVKLATMKTWSIIAPIIGGIVAFAKSKHASVKEKKMIIDEIDIELQVLEREISRAEQSGSTKKYRQLLTIQKNLMRKRQEIYYGLTMKGKRIPMQATTGLRSRE